MSDPARLAIVRATISVGYKTRMLDNEGQEVQYSMSEMQVAPEIVLLGSPIEFQPGDADSEAAAIEALSNLTLVIVRATARAFIVQVREAAVKKIHRPVIPPEQL